MISEEQNINLTERSMFEICVLCKKQTQILKDTPIEYREHYIEGGGQLCDECGKTINKENYEFRLKKNTRIRS